MAPDNPSGGVARVYLGSATGLSDAFAVELAGRSALGSFGASVASAGDVNADGYGDIVVGAPTTTMGSCQSCGSASVFLGNARAVEPTAAVAIIGAARGDTFGLTVASAGDVNADGFGDLIVGAPNASPTPERPSGTATIFHGNSGGISLAGVSVRLRGAAVGDGFGWSVARAGDVNQDGYSDVIVGAPFAEVAQNPSAGTASVFLGTMAGITVTPARVLGGENASDNFGYAVAGAGDVNSDGPDDIVVGAPFFGRANMMNAGSTSVFHGSMNGIAANAAVVMVGEAGGGFGFSVAGAGDVNGDGFGDLIVGEPFLVTSEMLHTGVAAVFHGSMSGIPATSTKQYNSGAAAEQFGFSVAANRYSSPFVCDFAHSCITNRRWL